MKWLAGIFLGMSMLIANAQEQPLPRELALRPAVINTAPGPEYGDDTRQFQGIPGIERAPGGRLWALWYGGGKDEGPENYVVAVTSGDNGFMWSKPRLVIDPPGPVRAYDPTLWLDPQNRLWLFWAQAHSWWDGRSGTWAIVSENPDAENPTWSAPRRLCDGIMMNKPTVLSTGEWLLPVSVWPRHDNVANKDFYVDLSENLSTNVIVSTDNGQTFALRGQAKISNRVFDEHMIVERRDGSLWMLVRTQDGIAESVSADRGFTWSEGKRTDLHFTSARFFVRRLRSGELLLVRHFPPGRKNVRSHLTAQLSEDDGKTWSPGLLLDERAGVSYPDGTQAPDGSIYLIYDYARKTEKQILMATFTAADVRRGIGGTFSDKARFRVVVNQATGQ